MTRKYKKKLTLSRSSRNKICLDESIIWNMKMTWKYGQSGFDNSRLSYLIGYLYDEATLKQHLGITGTSYDFTSMTPETKTFCLYKLTRPKHAKTAN